LSNFFEILKWTLIILFFPLSLIFVAYYRRRKEKENYWNEKDSEKSTTYNNGYNSLWFSDLPKIIAN